MVLGKRRRRHVVIFISSGALAGIIYVLNLGHPVLVFRLSLATAYTGLALMAVTFMLGPWNILRRRSNPISTTLRRDLGTWAGVYGLLHTLFGLQIHTQNGFWLYFIYPRSEQHAFPLRLDLFGMANYTGLAVTLILVLLMSLSNNVSLRVFGPQRWKALQRYSYISGVLLIVHGVAYLVIEGKHRPLFYIVIFAVVVTLTLVAQFAGFIAVRRRRP